MIRQQTIDQRSAGFTLIEVAIGVVIMTVAFVGLSGLLIVNERSQALAAEEAQATSVLRGVAEQVRATAFENIGFVYLGVPVAVPEINGTSTVTAFLDETASGGDAGQLALPRDLDGDGAISNTNVLANYKLLPVKVELSWTGLGGSESRSLYLLLARED